MEFKITCPDCGKVHSISITEDATSEITLTSKTKKKTSWSEIAKDIHSGNSSLELGNEITCTLKNGLAVVLVVAALNPYASNEVAFVIKDCMPDTHCMNEHGGNKGGWNKSDLNKYLNTDIFDLLPDDLKAVIKERVITQKQGNKEYTASCKLWCPSYKEITGRNNETDVDDVHFPLFSDERSRVKQVGEGTMWYWTRTPYTGSTNGFVFVSTGGNSNNYNATTSGGVAFGFLI